MKKLKILFIIFPFLSFGQDSETYRVIGRLEGVEFREYIPLLFASYVNSEDSENSSFRVLANYIFGSNDTEEEIAMTSPVVIRLFNDNEMLFRMPEKYDKKNIPKPNNINVKFLETNSVQKAVIQYSGYTNRDKENRKISELKTILDKQGVEHNHKFELFIYDPPYKLFNRRNEISVNILNSRRN